MKILRITLRNIASLAGQHTVDFTVAPLRNAGLFSISGPTGSGKSTLLDALCLALYDKTPRMAVAEGTQALLDAGAEVQQNDVRNLLRRGCGTGFAEVAFVGVDGETYTARWEIRRARETAGGRLQKTQHSLLKGNIPSGKEGSAAASGTATEVKKAIVEKLGLSFDQFRRAVLLAQGDFATFLKARDTERAEILQALTGTERFEKISKAVFLRNKREFEEVQALRSQLGATPPLSTEARAEAEEALRGALVLQKQIEQEVAKRNKQLAWFQEEAGHRQKLNEASSEVSRLEAQVQSNVPRMQVLGWIREASLEAAPFRVAEKQAQSHLEEALQREASLRQLDAALQAEVTVAEARHTVAKKALESALEAQQKIDAELAKARVLDGELAQMEKAATLAQREYNDALETFNAVKESLTVLHQQLLALSQEKAKLQQRIAQVASFGPFARDVEVWLERFKSEEKARLKRDQLEMRVQKAQKECAKTAAQFDKFSVDLMALRQRRDQTELDWKSASARAASFDPEQMMAERRNAMALQANLQTIRTQLTEQTRLQQEHQICKESLLAVTEQAARESVRRVELHEKRIPEVLLALNQAREKLRIAETVASEHAVSLRGTLVGGEACPVCGSLEHPYKQAEVTVQNAVIEGLKRETSEQEKALRILYAELAAAEVRIEEKHTQHQTLTLRLAQLDKILQEAHHFTPPVGEVAALLQKPAAQRDAEWLRLEAKTAQHLAALDKTDADRIAAEKLQLTLRAAFDKADQALHSAELSVLDARNVRDAAQTEYSNAQSDWAAANTEHAYTLEVLAPVVCALQSNGGERQAREGSIPKTSHAVSLEAFRDWFTQNAREYNAASELFETSVQEESVKLLQRGGLEDAFASAQRALSTRSTELEDAKRVLSDKKAARLALLDGRTVEAVEHDTASQVKTATIQENESSAACAEALKKFSTHQGLLSDQQSRLRSLEAAVSKANALLDGWISTFVAREGIALERVQLDEWFARGSQWIIQEQAALDTVVRQLAEAKGMETGMHQQLQEHLSAKTTEEGFALVEAEAQRLEGEAESARKVVDQHRALVLSDDERIRKTGELSIKLQAQEKQWEPWMKLNELIGSQDGTRFRNIAQQWTLEILLKHANAQLTLLSGRYRLERLRDSLNLLVTDLEMDGQQRSVHSLSGGESFLVSLGLALGLASLTSSRLLIESLFIDEGFGSLDSETLRVALNALNHLEAQGRKVGVISHVSEMVDAIPVQIRVVRGPGGASKIMV